MANNISVKDASASTQILKTSETAGVHTPHHLIDGTVAVTGTVELGNTSLSALENIQVTFPSTQNVNVQNASLAVTDNGGSLTIDGTVELGATSLTALENIQVTFPTTQNVSVQNASLAVTGTFWQATQPVSGTFWQATQPISAASLPLPTGAASETTLSSVNTKLPSNLTVSSTRLLVDGSGVTQPVSGTVTANAGSGSFAVAQATASNLNATVVQSTATNLRTQAESYQGGTAVGSGNPLQVTLANTGANTTALRVEPKNGAVTRTTGDTATANTSKEALASSSSRRYLLIQNISDTDMYFNFGATATTSNMLIPKAGGGIVFESGYVPTDAVNVICSGASKKYFILSA